MNEFVIIGDGEDFQEKPGARVYQRECPDCKRLSIFREVVPTEFIHLFTIPVLTAPVEGAESAFECSSCGKRFKPTGEFLSAAEAIVHRDPADESDDDPDGDAAKRAKAEAERIEEERKRKDAAAEAALAELKDRLNQ